jgi:hypothetical protein
MCVSFLARGTIDVLSLALPPSFLGENLTSRLGHGCVVGAALILVEGVVFRAWGCGHA